MRDKNPTRTNAIHFENHFNSLLMGLSDYVLLNDSEDLDSTQLGVGITKKRILW
jgi:hypothetical protein